MYREAGGLLVAKFGGTSMAHPEVAQSQLEYEQNAVDVVIVSAAGKDKEKAYPVKVTNMLLGYKQGVYTARDIQERFAAVLERTGMGSDPASLEIIENIPADLDEWMAGADPSDPEGPNGDSNPVDALGEYWSAKLFALQTGREFVDAREIIFFDNNGQLKEEQTFKAIQARLSGGGKYVVPGYFGLRDDGRIQKFPRGGSDISGAIIAKALRAERYDNWSDVPGFMSADPRKVQGARLISRATYNETRELGHSGSELLNKEVNRYLGGTGIHTIMRETRGPLGNYGTEVQDSRAWQLRPIIAVAGRDDLVMVSMHEFGMNDESGQTLGLTQAIADKKISYERGSDATDDISLLILNKFKKPLKEVLAILRSANPNRTLQTQPAGLMQIVGEGLSRSGVGRGLAHGRVLTALAESGIENLGGNDSGVSASISFFLKPDDIARAVKIAHDTLELGKD